MNETHEFDDCAGCVCAGVRRAARALTQHYARHMRGTGLVGTQFSTLAVLVRGGPMPVGRLAKQIGVERTTLTRNLKPLEHKAWIKISGDGDGRVRFVAITAKGRAVAQAALPHWRKAQATVGPKLKELRLPELLARAT
jgi:DNA-binding MarR family transcriptional regulator